MCEGSAEVHLSAVPDRFCGVPGTFSYRRCRSCGSVFQDPRVLEEDLAICYPASYYTHAANFYYQKQIATKTPLVVVLRSGEEVHGVLEWYDKCCIKLTRNGSQSNLLIYKQAIKYMYKESEG